MVMMMATKANYQKIFDKVFALALNLNNFRFSDLASTIDVQAIDIIDFKDFINRTISELPDDPRPCPFCGAEATIEDGKDWAHVRCINRDCAGTTTRMFSTREEAIEAWNKRTDDNE